ncbi:hypothetical protein ABFV05_017172 [Capra hircus]
MWTPSGERRSRYVFWLRQRQFYSDASFGFDSRFRIAPIPHFPILNFNFYKRGKLQSKLLAVVWLLWEPGLHRSLLPSLAPPSVLLPTSGSLGRSLSGGTGSPGGRGGVSGPCSRPPTASRGRGGALDRAPGAARG